METEVRTAVAGIVAEISLRVDADTAAARAEIEALDHTVDVEVRASRTALENAERQIADRLDRAGTLTPAVDRAAARRAGRTAGEEAARGQAEGFRRVATRLGRRERLVVEDLARYRGRLSPDQSARGQNLRDAARQVDYDAAARAQQARITQQLARQFADAMSRAQRQFDDLRGEGGNGLTRRSRSRRIQDLQAAMADARGPFTPGMSDRPLTGRLTDDLRVLAARYRRATDVQAGLERMAGEAEAALREARKAFRAVRPDDAQSARARAEASRARDRAQSLIDQILSSPPRTALARVRGKAERILQGAPLNDALEEDQRAIREAARAAQNVDAAERAVARTRRSLDAATAAVNAAEERHGELLRASDADARKVARSEAALIALRARRAVAAQDYTAAQQRQSYAQTALIRDESALDRRVEMPIFRRFSEAIDERTTRILDGLTERLLLTGRLLTATTQVAVGAGAALAALGAVNLVPLVGSLLQAGTALAVLPALAAGAAASITAIVVGSTGVPSAFKAATQMTTNSGRDADADARTREQAARRIAQAQRSVEDAYRSSARTAVQGQEAVAAAERTVERAQRSATDAQKALSQARRDAVQRIRDVNDALRGSATSERQAYLATLRARQNLADALRAGGASGLDIQELQVAITAADETYDDVRRRNQQLREEAEETNRRGIDGDAGVVRAKEAVLDATDQQAEAQAALGRTIRDAAEADADAQRRIADAIDSQSEALRTATENVSTWERKYSEALANLSPQAREFVENVRGMGDAWRSMRLTVQDSLFQGLAADVTELGRAGLPVLSRGLDGIAVGINSGLRRSLRYLSTDLANVDLQLFFVNASRASAQAARAFEPLTRTILGLSATGSAFLPQILSGLADEVERFDTKVAAMRADGSLAAMIDTGIERTKQLGRVIRDTFGVLRQVFRATGADGDSMLDGLERRVRGLRDRLASSAGQDGVRDFFDSTRAAWDRLYPVMVALASVFTETVLPAVQTVGTPILHLIGTFAELAVSLERVIPLLETLVTAILAIKTFNALSALVAGIGAGFLGAGRGVASFNARLEESGRRSAGLQRLSGAVSSIGAGIASWGGYIAAAALAFGYLSSKADEFEGKIAKSEQVFRDYQQSEPEFRERLTEALSESDGVADERVRAAIANRLSERIDSLRTIDDEELDGWALSGGFGLGVGTDDVADARARRDFAANAVGAWEKLRATYGDVADAIVGTNEQYDALIARVRATGTEGDALLPVLQYLRNEFNQSVASASRMASAYDAIRAQTLGAAEAVDTLTEAFAAQRRDARIQDDARLAADEALDQLESILSKPLTADDGATALWLADLIEANGRLETTEQAGRDLTGQLDQLATAFAGVGAAAYVAAREAGQSEEQATTARAAAMREVQDRLIAMLDDQLPRERIDALLSYFRLIPEALADPPRLDIDTSPAQQSLDELEDRWRRIVSNSPENFAADANPYNVTLSDTERAAMNSTPPEMSPEQRAAINDHTDGAAVQLDRQQVMDQRRDTLIALADEQSAYERRRLQSQLAQYNRLLGYEPSYLGYATPVDLSTPNAPPADALPIPTPGAPLPAKPDAVEHNSQPSTPGEGQQAAQPTAVPQVPDFSAAHGSFSTFADGVRRAYDEQLLPAFDGIATSAAAAGQAVVDASAVAVPAFTELGVGAAGLHASFRAGIEEGAVRAFQSLRPAIGLDIADITLVMLPALTRAVGDLAVKTRTSVQSLSVEWSAVRRAVADPVNWILDHVVNRGLRDAWTALRQVVPDLPEWTITVSRIEGYHTGGVIPGYTPGRDTRTIAVGGGEAIMRPEWVRAVGSTYVHEANAAARRNGVAGVRRYQSSIQHYATGGIVATADPLDPVQRSLWDAVRSAFPRAILTSAKRFRDVGAGFDYHMAGRAIDLGGPMAEIARWVYSRYPMSTELIHWPLAGWTNLKNGRRFDYGQPTNAQHVDHLHWANLGPIASDGQMISLAAGGDYLPGLGQQVLDRLVTPLATLRDTIPDSGTSLLGVLPRRVGEHLIDTVLAAAHASPALATFGSASGNTADVERWRPLVEKVLREKGQDLGETDRVLNQIRSESSGNPRAINLWDSNAAAGIPSKGLLQVIDPTFRAYADAGYNTDIYDPESNIRAAINYALRDPKYGSLAAAFRGVGYDQGGVLPHGGIGWNLSGSPEAVLTYEQWSQLADLIEALAGAARLTVPDIDPGHAPAIVEQAQRVISEVVTLLGRLMPEAPNNPGQALPQNPATATHSPPVLGEEFAPGADMSVDPGHFDDPVKPEDRHGPGEPPLPQPMSPELFTQTFGPRAMDIVSGFFTAQWDGVRSDLGLRDSGFLTRLVQNGGALREGGQQAARVVEEHIHYHVRDLDEAMRRESLRQRQKAAGYIQR
ncbi:transglycosylase SLT domain-containing protein [Nocardia puris]|nr:transglycosylase SLT domain-containing protein [Nocardia puris]